ncbi:cupredoxin domain-containing protein [Paucidesulfovibrio longus]|uniref:hypothetical protein n=1 Tax=Paucidesulfovibrio longus TaxID=889 RepID=UPI0003B3AD67|nr:hypothetical protein [Paucidesulfovibrio longus]
MSLFERLDQLFEENTTEDETVFSVELGHGHTYNGDVFVGFIHEGDENEAGEHLFGVESALTEISPSKAGFIVEIHIDAFHDDGIEFFVIGSESNDWAQEIIRTRNDGNGYEYDYSDEHKFSDYIRMRPFIYDALGRVGAV